MHILNKHICNKHQNIKMPESIHSTKLKIYHIKCNPSHTNQKKALQLNIKLINGQRGSKY